MSGPGWGGVSNDSIAGAYGTKGVGSPGNLPGYRSSSASWTDAQGNLWMFGSSGNDSAGNEGCLSDLWSFSPVSNEWTWMGGSDTAAKWTQSGVYGTQGTPDSTSYPECRSNAVTWADASGNLWLFGGNGNDSLGSPGYLNDLWKYNPTTNQWTWMAGNSTLGTSYLAQPGIYGTQGTAAASNTPGGRWGAVGWTDSAGNLWLFGGHGVEAAGREGVLNDLWEFSSSSGRWTWMGGQNQLLPSLGRPGNQIAGWMTPAAGNMPGGRVDALGWVDQAGNLWLFGGYWGLWVDFTTRYANDLWEFNPGTHLWTWWGAVDNAAGNSATYGTFGVPSLLNNPGPRFSAATWADSSGRLWMMGGETGSAAMDDLWMYSINPSSGQAAASPVFTPASSSVPSGQQVTVTDATSGAAIYYEINQDGTPIPYSGPISVTASESISAFAAASGMANSPVSTATFSVALRGSLVTLVAVLLGTASLWAHPEKGTLAPPLDSLELLQAPLGARADWASLKGKVVVLEFWATWCSPILPEMRPRRMGHPAILLAMQGSDPQRQPSGRVDSRRALRWLQRIWKR